MVEVAIKIDLDVSSRRCSPTYNALSAVAIVTNTSKVVTRITKAQWEVRVLSPYTDADVEDKVKEYQDYQRRSCRVPLERKLCSLPRGC